jgi:hypothetical protein
MEIVVSVFAIIIALGCVVAIYLASQKERRKGESE